jgi:hypothetical protein
MGRHCAKGALDEELHAECCPCQGDRTGRDRPEWHQHNGQDGQIEFARRRAVAIAGIRTWIVSCEDLILSKLVWALESNSELQRRDIHQLLAGAIDLDYIRKWAPQLGVTTLLNELMP